MKGVPLLIDTNLLVLFVVGKADKGYIAKHKKLTAFTVEDYEMLVRMVAGASEVLVTPNTLTETSNLAAYINEPARSKVLAVLRTGDCRFTGTLCAQQHGDPAQRVHSAGPC